MPKITEMYCFAVEDGEGGEGIPAILMGDVNMPLVGADLERMKSWLPLVKASLAPLGKVRLYRFTTQEEIDWRKL